MTTKLHILRERLTALRRRRLAVRLGTAWSTLAVALLWMLAAAWLLDWLTEWDRWARLGVLAACAAGGVWTFRRFCVPWLRVRETDLDMAILIERQQHIDSDLVAALQFEQPQAAAWGSPQLERAVVDYVAEFGNELDVRQGFNSRPLPQRLALLAASAAVLLAGGLIFPGHAAAFFNRFCLGNAHYPTRTRIESAAVNAVPVLPMLSEDPVRSPEGRPLQFAVSAAGELPALGKVRLLSVRSGVRTEIELAPVEGSPGQYAGRLPRLIDDLQFQLFLGDAWTDPLLISAIRLPVVNLTLTPTPPDYAAGAAPAEDAAAGARQIAVLEGSRLDVRVACANKRLAEAELTVGEESFPLVSLDDSGRAWRLDVEGTPLARVSGPLQYALQVQDEDGLQLEQPLQGFVRIKPDRPPRITADLVTRRVLPQARPKLRYQASDDYGISRLLVHRQAVRGGGGMDEDNVVEIALDGLRTAWTGSLHVDLSSLGLVKGDQLKITLEAIDYRGEAAGRSSLSEPLVLEVTDERGVLAGMLESDERLARQLDAVIERQVGVGESP